MLFCPSSLPRPAPALLTTLPACLPACRPADAGPAIAARNAMHGRKFGGRVVEAVLMGDQDYSQFIWD